MSFIFSDSETEPSSPVVNRGEGKEDAIPEGLTRPLLRRHNAMSQPSPDVNPECGSSSSSSVNPPIRSPPKKKQKYAQSRSFVFTLNNYTEDDKKELLASVPSPAQYIGFGEEISASGTSHLQGVVVFPGRKTIGAVSKINSAHKRCHIEIMRGTFQQAIQYCKKDGQFVEAGLPPMSASDGGEANKERWELARKAALDGDWDSVPSDIFIRSYSSLRSIHKDFQTRPADAVAPCGFWLIGLPGYGKSRVCRFEHPLFYPKPLSKWWDNYKHEVPFFYNNNKNSSYLLQPVIILDDVDTEHTKWIGSFLKIWSDSYAFVAESKGGSLVIRPKRFIVTSNYSIETLFGHDEQLKLALIRRFTTISLPFPLPNTHFESIPYGRIFPILD